MEQDNIDKKNCVKDANPDPTSEEKPQQQPDLWFDDGDSQLDEDEQLDIDTQIKESSVVEGQNIEQTPQIKETAKKGHVFDRKDIEDKYQDLHTFQHTIDSNYLILMAVLNKYKIVNFNKVSELKVGYLDMNIKGGRVAVKTTCQEEATKVIQKLSDFVDRLAVIKIDIRSEMVNKFVHFEKLTAYFRKDKIVLFANGAKEMRTLYMGGHMKSSQLRNNLQRIKAIKVQKTTLRTLRNTRSYKIIISEILNMQSMQNELIKFNQVSFAEIDQRNKNHELVLSLGTISKRQLTPNDYEDFIMKQLRKYYVLTLCFITSPEKYIQVPKCQKVVFRFTSEKYVKKSFMYIIALKQDFYEKRDEIYKYIETLRDRIIGVRFFYHLFPVSHDFVFAKEKYYLFRFPINRPYSISFGARTREGETFNLRAFYERFLEVVQDKRTSKTMIQ